MSLDFKLHYDRLREGDPTKPTAAAEPRAENTFYDAPGHARNLCLAWPDGKQQFISYSYLVGGELAITGELNVITLDFSSYAVTLKGYQLENLFNAIIEQLLRCVIQTDVRYFEAVENSDKFVVIDIKVDKKQ